MSPPLPDFLCLEPDAVIPGHGRRIKTEEKAKVVVAYWGMELIQFLAAVAILHQDNLKKRMNRTATLSNGCFEKIADNHTNPPSWHPCC